MVTCLVTRTRMNNLRSGAGDTEEDSTAEDLFSVCLNELEGYLHEVHVALGAYMDPESTDSIIIKCERLLIAVLLLMVEGDSVVLSDEILNGLDILHSYIEEVITVLYSEIDFASVRLTQVASIGRPKLNICKEQLQFLLHANFTLKDIAAFFRCSSKTISRRIQEYDLTTYRHMQIPDDILDQVTLAYVKQFPNAGQKSFAAFLLEQGIHVPRQKVRDSMLRVDPDGVMGRFRNAIKRRSYHVPGPIIVWHIDGYHKLIKWGIVIHGAVDGYS